MKTTTSVARLMSAGLKFEAAEAVAITQQLISTLCSTDDLSDLAPPYGPPTAASVFLRTDGSVRCVGCGATPAISEIAIFLDTILPAGSPRVPGALRYTIARGMLDVDVPPFDSLREFSEALARHEVGARDAVVRAALQRAAIRCTALIRPANFDRRVTRVTNTDLRRELRNADARLYQMQVARATGMMSIPAAAVRPRRMETVPAIAACLGAGFMLIAAGELMHGHYGTALPNVVPPAGPERYLAEPARPIAPAVDMPAVEPSAAGTPVPGNVSLLRNPVDTPRADARIARPRSASARTAAKRPARASAVVHRIGTGRQSPGVMDRLRLGWLRDAFKTSL